MNKNNINTAGMEAIPVEEVREANEDLMRHLSRALRALGKHSEPVKLKRSTWNILAKGMDQLIESQVAQPMVHISDIDPEHEEVLQRYGLTFIPED